MNALDELIQAGGDIHRYFTDAEIAEARAYEAPLLYKAWVDTALFWSELVLFMVLGLNRRLLRACEAWAARRKPQREGLAQRLWMAMEFVWKGPGWLGALGFLVAYVSLFFLLDLPEGIYFDHIREAELGLTNQSLWGYLGDCAIDFGMTIGFRPLGLFAMFALIRWLGDRWWWVLGAVAMVVLLVFAGRFDGQRARLLYDSHELEAGPLRDAITKVMADAHVEYGSILVINISRNTNKSNAYVAGEGASREIVIFDTMIRRFSVPEIAVTVAHEVGHVREKQQPRLIASALMMIPLMFFIDLLLKWGARRKWLGIDEPSQVSGLPLLRLAWSLLLFTANPVSNTFQREREADADYYALQLTHDPEHLRTLMVKLNKENKVDPNPASWKEFMYASHPAVARRLAMAYRFEKDPATAR